MDAKALYSDRGLKAHTEGEFYIHHIDEPDKGVSTGWSLNKLVQNSLGDSQPSMKDVPRLIVSHVKASGSEWAGSQTFNGLDQYMASIIKKRNMSRAEIRRNVGLLMAALNSPEIHNKVTFSLNTSPIPESWDTEPAELRSEMTMFNQVLVRMLENEFLNGRFNVTPVVNVTSRTDWSDPGFTELLSLAYKYGAVHFVNYSTGTLVTDHIHSQPDAEPDSHAIYLRHGGIPGNADYSGLTGLVTLNLPQIAYKTRDEDQFFERLSSLMETATDALEAKKRHLEGLLSNGKMPSTSSLHDNLDWHFSGIALSGMNEALLNVIDAGTAHVAGKAVTYKLLEYLIRYIEMIQAKTGHLYTLEAYPSEEAGAHMAGIDKTSRPEIIASGVNVPYYTGSTELPPSHGDDLWDMLEHQKKYHGIYTGGTAIQIHLKEGQVLKDESMLLLRRCMDQFGYNSLKVSPVFSLCDRHGYTQGEVSVCPVCGDKTATYVWVDGYPQELSKIPEGLKEAHRQRVHYDVKNN
ncbi:MAG: hypothetical protein NWE89_13070 [Candidatus Bathyarchaeota archaeon]|nr:hypothetical protein [Candidatus Bathyarchaeota archaeon]